jgi:phosphatidylserine/phosphatidylglycerophosphate/cardiolipin synthase-like enzyme
MPHVLRMPDSAGSQLDADPALSMTLVLDFRRDSDTTATSVLARRRSEDFWKRDWPKASRRPRLLYDPRGLEPDSRARAAMHAKVVVVDRKIAFVSSANLTERAQERNVEVGALIREESLARQLAEYFEGLERQGVLRSAGGEDDQ